LLSALKGSLGKALLPTPLLLLKLLLMLATAKEENPIGAGLELVPDWRQENPLLVAKSRWRVGGQAGKLT